MSFSHEVLDLWRPTDEKKMPPDLQPTQDWCHRVWPHTSSQSCEHRDPCRCNSSGSIKVESGRISFQHWLDLHLFLFQNDPSLLFGAFGASPVFMPPSKPSKSEKKTKPPKKKVPPPWQTRNLENPKPAKWFQEILCHLLQSYASHGPHLSLSSCGMSIFRLGLGSFEIVGNLVPTRL